MEAIDTTGTVFTKLLNQGVYVKAAKAKDHTDSGIKLPPSVLKDKGIGEVVLVSDDMKDCKIKTGDKIMYRVVSTVQMHETKTDKYVLVEYRDVIGILG